MKNLIKLIKQKKASISIIGLGYVGLPLAIKFSNLVSMYMVMKMTQKKYQV